MTILLDWQEYRPIAGTRPPWLLPGERWAESVRGPLAIPPPRRAASLERAAEALPGPTAAPPHTIAAVKNLLEKTSNLFRWRLLGLGERLGASADWIAAVMASESAGTFSPSVRNPSGGATGLIQFMPATAARLGTTTSALAAMTAEDQLLYVERYFQPFAGRMRSATDVYMAVFMPAFVGRAASTVIGREDDETEVAGGLTLGQVYKYNRGFDHDENGEITVGEVGATVESLLRAAAGRPRIDVATESVNGGGGIPVGPGLAIAAAATAIAAAVLYPGATTAALGAARSLARRAGSLLGRR